MNMHGRAVSRSGEKLGVLLYQPEIPQNTGNIARTCAATHTPLYLVEPLGFRITDKQLKRAGLDYWPYVRMKLYPDFEAAHIDIRPSRRFILAHAPGCIMIFLFVPETAWFSARRPEVCPKNCLFHPGDVVQVPIDRVRVRSLNLATTVGIALFEALRQLRY